MPKSVATFRHEVEAEVTDDFVRDIMIAALYNGIDYWCDGIIVSDRGSCTTADALTGDILMAGGAVQFHTADDEEWHTLNLDGFINGIKLALDWYGTSIEEFYDRHDAGWADNLIQFALFGDIVYG